MCSGLYFAGYQIEATDRWKADFFASSPQGNIHLIGHSHHQLQGGAQPVRCRRVGQGQMGGRSKAFSLVRRDHIALQQLRSRQSQVAGWGKLPS